MGEIQTKLKYAKITIENIQNIEESWDICDPMFNMIDGYEGYDKYLKTSERFTLEQRYLCAIHWYFGEVINGGYKRQSKNVQKWEFKNVQFYSLNISFKR